MSVWIQHIETMTPEHVIPQDYASGKMQEWIDDDRLSRLIRVLYKKSGIDRRYSVISSFDQNLPGDFFPLDTDGRRRELSTAERNAIYARESHRMSVELARRAIAGCPGTATQDITHVITVSCTGFSNPGPDYHIVNELGLSDTTQRYNLGFMGCYAAFPGMRMAKQFCEANPDAVVLVMCLELCSLHLQLNDREDSMLANSLFSDGAAAVIISAREPQSDQSCYRLGEFHCSLIPSGKSDMAWTIGDLGFDIALSSYVPKIIGANIQEAIKPLLASGQLGQDDIRTWAVHPGGKAILDKVAQSLELDASQILAARNVLRQYGNMSSVTILFVLQEILADADGPAQENVCAMAFGPGLTVEMGLLEAQRGVAKDNDMYVLAVDDALV
ncbi:MAG: type III polyketide synthase [Desulfuromusa sp.]|nr:type III polyketide synthase [Desulfuromusa sp.]